MKERKLSNRRICIKCKKRKSINSFYRDNHLKSGYAACCKVCRRPTQLNDKTNRKVLGRAFIDGYKTAPCIDCGNKWADNPECMDFDHLDPTMKHKNVSRLADKSLETIWKEIQKCDLVCACCHRIRTKRRRSIKPATLGPD